ncbi:hypothetical protein [Acetobacter okinawensis]|uniref:hypothetical protein n=1 Tax=Acetobacter okinawensis TaxID=1076594 RepID=UPI00209DF6F6|nr:hypothetical protein [Acetobacter okinawensis]MCP1211898.1 hypothetical protein [Acetobacter okinawensis]
MFCRLQTLLLPGLLLASLPAGNTCHAAPLRVADILRPTTAWQTYTNERFGYQICYPADVFVPQGEPDNRDGQHFLAPDGGDLTVFGSFSPNTLGEEISYALADLTGKKGTISYRSVHKDWAVFSGDDGGKSEFYEKIVLKNTSFPFSS